jgi:hypothetical protein
VTSVQQDDEFLFSFYCSEELREQPYSRYGKCLPPSGTHKHFVCPESLLSVSLFIVLFGISLWGHTLLYSSRKAARNFYPKWSSRMNTRSAREHIMFASAQRLRNRREQRPSNQDDADVSVTGEVWSVYYTKVDLLLIYFLCRSTWPMLGRVLNSTSFVYTATVKHTCRNKVHYLQTSPSFPSRILQEYLSKGLCGNKRN